MSGNEINTQMLLSAGVNVDIVNKNGWTPLFNAVYWNHPSIAEMLLANGSSPFLKNKVLRNVEMITFFLFHVAISIHY